ncbi:hypothetical protein [Undibacterium rugosum]|uniref:hypothetical protein n=1 Tax=Undibacterium rugosum TaxID=2762291 RepID=UPI001BAFB7DA|nr:hypothetical protein [Undibacterium rugosum]
MKSFHRQTVFYQAVMVFFKRVNALTGDEIAYFLALLNTVFFVDKPQQQIYDAPK